MDNERLKYIVSRISGLGEYIPLVVFLESLVDRETFVEYVKNSPYWNSDNMLDSIMDFANAYVKNNNIDVNINDDQNSSLKEVYSQFSNMSLYEMAYRYASNSDEKENISKRR